MTCIVGLAHEGKVYMGGDSAGVGGYDMSVRSAPKVFKRHGFLIGYTDSFRMGLLLEHQFEPPRFHDADKIEKFMAIDFVNAVRSCLKEGGYAEKKNEQESGGMFLAGFKGRLFLVQGDYSVLENVRKYDAVGCGFAYAMGSMHRSENDGTGPAGRVMEALKAAEDFSAGVRGPFHLIESD